MDTATSISNIKKYVRAANYLTVAQIYLQNNFLLQWELTQNDIKPRLLGHWGTCPGINFVYAHLNSLIAKHKAQMLFIVGPGHGFPAIQSNLFLEGTLSEYYPEATRDLSGISYICKNFSWPYGFPSHSNPSAPGVIVEGGELGYALSTAYGAVLDNPYLVVPCLIGDGEAETGPTATAWHLNKFIDPATNGAVLPILHLNGYKISGPTIFGRMTDEELKCLFMGYGYHPFIVEESEVSDIYESMHETLERAYEMILEIQKSARRGKSSEIHKFPMIILKTPKGWTGIKELNNEKIEGNYLSHQVIASNSKTDDTELKQLENWIRSYKFEELFDGDSFSEDIISILPEQELRLGNSKYTQANKVRHKLLLPKSDEFAEDADVPGTIGSSSMRRAGAYLNEVFALNYEQKNFRLFSPDETYSNKLDEVFKTTSRAFMLPEEPWDKDITTDGRVIEMLSEHSLQGLMQGYILTGRHAVFASYEAFIQIVSSMADQYAKFLKIAKEIPWRGEISSFNYILTSSGWRQDHNGFSHQNPGFIGELMEKEEDFIKFYFPPDGNSTLIVLEKCLQSTNGINVIVAGKTLEPRWLTPKLAERELEKGLMTWDFLSDADPDLVICGIGDYVTNEAIGAMKYIKEDMPDLKVRFVNVMDLMALKTCDFEEYFTKDKPVIFNFHGYPMTLKKLLFDRSDTERFFINGYIENGSTTTPFDMQIRNKTSRWDLALQAYSILADRNMISLEKLHELNAKYEEKFHEHKKYIVEFGVDPEII